MLADGLGELALFLRRTQSHHLVGVVVRPVQHGFGPRHFGRAFDLTSHAAKEGHELGMVHFKIAHDLFVAFLTLFRGPMPHPGSSLSDTMGRKLTETLALVFFEPFCLGHLVETQAVNLRLASLPDCLELLAPFSDLPTNAFALPNPVLLNALSSSSSS